MTEVVLHLGSNLGYREINLELALIIISNHIGEIQKQSSVYETAAWGNEQQNDFLNQAFIVTTSLTATEVLAQIQHIESKMGRKREERWGPRLIDIDIIFYGEDIIDIPNLKIPHTQMSKRSFVLQPLLDICPDKIHPKLGKSIRQLAEECDDHLAVQKIK